MPQNKILREHYGSVIYSEDHWSLLKAKRTRAIELLDMFVKEGLNPFVYGSTARGDINSNSDIDIIFPKLIQPFHVEYILNKQGVENYFREIIMATPNDTIKLYIYLSELESITIPLSKFDKKSIEFYDFGGKVDIEKLRNNIRIPGIDKRLILIKPTSNGHEELSIINNEHIAAKEVNVSIDTIIERRNVHLKREKYGKTGVFLKQPIEIHESTEAVLKRLARKKSVIRKKLHQR